MGSRRGGHRLNTLGIVDSGSTHAQHEGSNPSDSITADARTRSDCITRLFPQSSPPCAAGANIRGRYGIDWCAVEKQEIPEGCIRPSLKTLLQLQLPTEWQWRLVAVGTDPPASERVQGAARLPVLLYIQDGGITNGCLSPHISDNSTHQFVCVCTPTGQRHHAECYCKRNCNTVSF